MPPEDIWPYERERFTLPVHAKRVNTSTHWVIPKISLLKPKFFLVPALLTLTGCDLWEGENREVKMIAAVVGVWILILVLKLSFGGGGKGGSGCSTGCGGGGGFTCLDCDSIDSGCGSGCGD